MRSDADLRCPGSGIAAALQAAMKPTTKIPTIDLARVTGGSDVADKHLAKLNALQLPPVPNAGDLTTWRSIK
jgi:hypothetical protein